MSHAYLLIKIINLLRKNCYQITRIKTSYLLVVKMSHDVANVADIDIMPRLIRQNYYICILYIHMPKTKKFTTPFNLNEWGREQLRIKNRKLELSRKFQIQIEDLADMRRRHDEGDTLENDKKFENLQKKIKLLQKMKKSKKKMLFVTLNFDEKMVTPTGTVAIVKKICNHPKVTNYRAYYEWRDVDAETGLHCHILLQGDTRRINEYLVRQKGPFTTLCSAFNTIKKYPIMFWFDKISYCEGKTNSDDKNDLKSEYPRLRLKYNLPNYVK